MADVPPSTNENPGELAGSTGAETSEEMHPLAVQDTLEGYGSAMALLLPKAHKAMVRMLGYALTLDDWQGWEQFGILACTKLSERERVGLAWAVLRSLDPDNAFTVAEDVIGGAGYPLPPFLNPIDDAAHWAGMATPEERRAYLMAAFRAMSQTDRQRFIEYAVRADAA